MNGTHKSEIQRTEKAKTKTRERENTVSEWRNFNTTNALHAPVPEGVTFETAAG
jgi:hypothetical protein